MIKHIYNLTFVKHASVIYMLYPICKFIRSSNQAPFATSTKWGTLKKNFWDFWPPLVHPMKIFHPHFAKSLFKSIIIRSDRNNIYTNKNIMLCCVNKEGKLQNMIINIGLCEWCIKRNIFDVSSYTYKYSKHLKKHLSKLSTIMIA